MYKKERLEKLKALLKKSSVDAFLIENPVNLFYLTGLHFSAGSLLISETATLLLVDGRYIESAKKQTLYPCEQVKEETMKEWLKSHHILKLGFEKEGTTYKRFLDLKEAVCPIELGPVDSPVSELRTIKDEHEIEALKKAARLGDEGYSHLLTLLKEGVQESELATELEFFWKKKGAEGVAFDPIIAFNTNGSMPHYRAGKEKLVANSSVLIDCGVLLNNYHSDMTRVFFFGNPAPEIQTILQIVREAQEKALAICKPGTALKELDKAARGFITEKGYGDFFNHNLGHGVGLEIHEAPSIRSKGKEADCELKEGMVITIEPGIYLPGIGGVRWEDTIVIRPNGYERITGLAFDN